MSATLAWSLSRVYANTEAPRGLITQATHAKEMVDMCIQKQLLSISPLFVGQGGTVPAIKQLYVGDLQAAC